MGHFQDGIISLQLPNFISFVLSYLNFFSPSEIQKTVALISTTKKQAEGFF